MSEADLREALAEVVRAQRAALRLSQRELAKRAGLADATISKVETKQLSPSLETLAKLAAGLEMSVGELVQLAAPNKGRMRPTYTVSSGQWSAMRQELVKQVVEDLGSVQQAADALSVARTTLRRWLDDD